MFIARLSHMKLSGRYFTQVCIVDLNLLFIQQHVVNSAYICFVIGYFIFRYFSRQLLSLDIAILYILNKLFNDGVLLEIEFMNSTHT